MSLFRKVREIDNIPSFIEKRFVGSQVDIDEDPYAELKNNSSENRIKISKQQIGFTKEATSLNKSWEKISGASTYQDLRTDSIEDRILSQELNAIKRADYGTDSGLNARTTTSNLKAYSSDEYMDCLLRGSANIFNPDMINITEEFMNSQISSSEQSKAELSAKREAHASRHASWEEKNLNSIREKNVVSSRAHSILRTSSDVEHTSQFGMVDPSALDDRESKRIAMQNQSREQRLAIKKNVQNGLSERSANRAQSLSDIYNSISLDMDIED
jgi:hypothetical protein